MSAWRSSGSHPKKMSPSFQYPACRVCACCFAIVFTLSSLLCNNKHLSKDGTMKIAQIAPPWITIPPKNYGGTESVLYNLVEQQVAQGHDVTLFAPGDAKTSAKLVSFFPKSLLQEGVLWTMHLKAFYHLEKSLEQVKEQDFEIVHTHSAWMALLG